ncbi:hypothetical protein A0H81_07707 [Grifola frondosa]|uniref:Uncharacterized protein n=1 Tax=Grifola frondosa TaxID=5627 RepID=A0A1C7M7A7_GRIFR|nr:hypothetical protein A0H81_07707 [Grifola frondosa]
MSKTLGASPTRLRQGSSISGPGTCTNWRMVLPQPFGSPEQHSTKRILDYFSPTECTVVLPRQPPDHPESLPPYLVSPISMVDYFLVQEPTFNMAPLHLKLMDSEMPLTSQNIGRRCVKLTLAGGCNWSLACTIYEITFEGSVSPSWIDYFSSKPELQSENVSSEVAGAEWAERLARRIKTAQKTDSASEASATQLRDLLRSMLQIEEEIRPGTIELLQHH